MGLDSLTKYPKTYCKCSQGFPSSDSIAGQEEEGSIRTFVSGYSERETTWDLPGVTCPLHAAYVAVSTFSHLQDINIGSAI